jgi:hypothetical protein
MLTPSRRANYHKGAIALPTKHHVATNTRSFLSPRFEAHTGTFAGIAGSCCNGMSLDNEEGFFQMRTLLGMILGALLTIAGAYAVDHARADATARPMVNWDVVRDNWNGVQASLRGMGNRVHDEWVKRSG